MFIFKAPNAVPDANFHGAGTGRIAVPATRDLNAGLAHPDIAVQQIWDADA